MNLINRAKRLVTEVEDISRELNWVQSTLESNNYPKAFIKGYLKCEDKDESKPAAKKWITKLVYQYLRFLSNKAHESCVSNRNSTEVNNGNNNNNNNVNKIQQTINSPGKSSFDSCVRDLQVTQKEAFLNRATFGPQETVIWIANMLHYTLPQDVHSAYL
ncbi:unnamed protein product, partial [Trichobilharzia regenti]